MPKGRGLYLHVPAAGGRELGREDSARYRDAVLAEVELLRDLALSSETLLLSFAIGGDPLALRSDDLASAIEGLSRSFRFGPRAERTCEASAPRLDPVRARDLRLAGVERLCLTGLGSFREEGLRAGRRALEAAGRAGFDDLAVDLPLSGPVGKPSGRADTDLRPILDAVSHVSLVEWEGAPPADELWIDAYRRAVKRLSRSGHERYEIAQFARAGQRSRHLLLVYGGGDVIGLGAGAASAIGPIRRRNLADRDAYVGSVREGRSPIEEEERLDRGAIAREKLLLGIRRVSGVPADWIEAAREGGGRQGQEAVLRRLEHAGLLRRRGARFLLTDRGILVADALAAELLEPGDPPAARGASLDKPDGGQ